MKISCFFGHVCYFSFKFQHDNMINIIIACFFTYRKHILEPCILDMFLSYMIYIYINFSYLNRNKYPAHVIDASVTLSHLDSQYLKGRRGSSWTSRPWYLLILSAWVQEPAWRRGWECCWPSWPKPKHLFFWRGQLPVIASHVLSRRLFVWSRMLIPLCRLTTFVSSRTSVNKLVFWGSQTW